MTQRLSAPGKVFLAGEYAALEGRLALVMGVDRELRAECVPGVHLVHPPGGSSDEGGVPGVHLVHLPSGTAWVGGPPPEPLRFAARAVSLALRLCQEEGLPRRAFRLVFENDLAESGVKLGLGGSAAACVLAVRAACAAQGRALTGAGSLALAVAAHWIEQGGSGSGADVAACAMGGVLRVRAHIPWRSPEEAMSAPARALLLANAVEARRVAVPADARFLLAFTGRSADTRALVRAATAFKARDPARWTAIAGGIERSAESLGTALEAGERDRALAAVRAGAAAMAKLGEASGAEIVTPGLARICELADSAGAAAKPSGAGGGDCAVVLAFGDEARDRAEAALRPYFSVFRIAPSA